MQLQNDYSYHVEICRELVELDPVLVELCFLYLGLFGGLSDRVLVLVQKNLVGVGSVRMLLLSICPWGSTQTTGRFCHQQRIRQSHVICTLLIHSNRIQSNQPIKLPMELGVIDIEPTKECLYYLNEFPIRELLLEILPRQELLP